MTSPTGSPKPLLTNRTNLLLWGLPTTNAAGQPIYGWLNTGARNPAPPGTEVEPLSAPPSTTDAATSKKDSIAHHSQQQRHRSKVPSTLLELHDGFVEVTPTPTEEQKEESKQKKTRRGSGSAKDSIGAKSSTLPPIKSTRKETDTLTEKSAVVVTSSDSTSISPGPPAPGTSETFEQRQARKLAAAVAASKDAERKRARIALREAAIASKLAEQEAEKLKAEQTEKARAAKAKQEKLKQREALAEAAQRRARQDAQTKENEEALKKLEEEQKEKERIALARLRSQLPVPTFFNPTLAYALKVEPSQHKPEKKKTTAKERDASTKNSNSSTSHSSVEEKSDDRSDEKSLDDKSDEKAHSSDHARARSLYDGSDWDALNSLKTDEDGEEEDAIVEEDEGNVDEEETEEAVVEEGTQHVGDSSTNAASTANASSNNSHVSSSTVNSSSPTGPSPSPTKPPNHTRSLSTIAREHIANQMTRITVKHVTATKQLQTMKRESRQKAKEQATVKKEKIDAIKVARVAELKRMQAAMDAQIASEDAARKAASYVLAMKLAKAAKDGDLERIRALAMDPHETEGDIVEWVNRHDSAGSTSIFHATWVANLPVLELLFKLGADVNHINNRLNTALHLACDRAHYSVIRLLINVGANPLLKNHQRNAPFEMQSQNSQESLEMALYIRQCLEDLILEKGNKADSQSVSGAGMATFAVHVDESEIVTSDAAAATTTTTIATAAPELRPVTPGTPASSTLTPAPRTLPPNLSARRLKPLKNDADPLKRCYIQPDDAALVANAKIYLAGINAYITGRIRLSQSMRRIKMKIWSAIRFARAMGRTSFDATPKTTNEDENQTKEPNHTMTVDENGETDHTDNGTEDEEPTPVDPNTTDDGETTQDQVYDQADANSSNTTDAPTNTSESIESTQP